jgi:chromosome partitioning protein
VKQDEHASRGIIIAIANQKGGVGKTTTTVNLAGELANRGARVLVIDCDPQGNATTSLGVDKRGLALTTYDALMDSVDVRNVIVPTGRGNYDLMPASEHLAGAMVELTTVEKREWQLAGVIKEVQGAYDRILIDCPPSLGLLTLNALCAAGSVLIPLQCEYLALEGLAQLKGTIDLVQQQLNPRLAILGVVMTMYDGRTNLAQQVVEEVRRYFPHRIFNTLIPRSVRVSEAPSYGQLLFEYDPQSRAAQAYKLLADEVIRRMG